MVQRFLTPSPLLFKYYGITHIKIHFSRKFCSVIPIGIDCCLWGILEIGKFIKDTHMIRKNKLMEVRKTVMFINIKVTKKLPNSKASFWTSQRIGLINTAQSTEICDD